MHLWRYITTRFPANIERSSLKTSNAFVLWRYVDVQIWRVKELFVPVASTIKPICNALYVYHMSLKLLFTIVILLSDCLLHHPVWLQLVFALLVHHLLIFTNSLFG